MIKQEVQNCIEEMLPYVESADYAGYDPYDALNSPLLRWLGANNRWARIGATQLIRRFPVNLRPLLGICKGRNPKGIGLFLWGYSRLFALTKEQRYLQRADYLIEILERLRSKDYSGNCWGYNFDWQSRTFMRPAWTPTIVNTAFIGHALLDCYELTGRKKALSMAVPIKDFILDDLCRTKLDGTFCFSYTPIDTEVIHNANLLGASILARLSRYCDDVRLIQAVLASLEYTIRHQREDGSWFYADTNNQRWVDSFHTGFNLEAIRHILDIGLAKEHQAAYHKGVKYYAENFFLKDGTPKYYCARTFPIDIHSPAQAICFFCREGKEYGSLTDKLVTWMLKNMYSGKGYFYFRKDRLFTNHISYIRWSQAWAFHALTEYLSANEMPY